MKIKVKLRKVVKDQYYVDCLTCKRTIVGNARSDVLHNLDTHLKNKHKESTGSETSSTTSFSKTRGKK